jgi:hypothetical protein
MGFFLVLRSIHNTYVLASGWSIVLDALRELKAAGLTDSTAKVQLQKNPKLRSRYLVLYDMVGVLANISQAKLSVLATTTRKTVSSECKALAHHA